MHYIGIDLGGTNIAAGVVSEDKKIIARDSVPTGIPRPAEEIIADMAELARAVTAQAGLTLDDIAWVGIGSPGTVNEATGVIEYANNLYFENVPMRDMLTKLLGKPIYLANDANAAAYGEVVAGVAQGCRNAVAITLGTGVGGGIIIDGKIYSGFNFAGAELGHMVIECDGQPCTCGRRGCWEAYSSATALVRMTREEMERDRGSVMWEMCEGKTENAGGKTAFDAMRRGDAAGKRVVDKYLHYLGCGLANIINIFQPEVLCLSGGISKEGDYLTVPLQKIIEKERYTKHSARQTRLTIAALGNDAGILGAAFLGKLQN